MHLLNQLWRIPHHAFADALDKPIACCFSRSFNGFGKSHFIGRAMALDYDATQSEQAGTIVATWIDAFLETVERRQSE
jgi:hypothetical protein